MIMPQFQIFKPHSFVEYSKVYSRDFSSFIVSNMSPLSFEPHIDVCVQTHAAREILISRKSEEIVKVSQAINYMTNVGNVLLQKSTRELFAENDNRRDALRGKGKVLYFLRDHFDLSSLKIKNLQWYEVFAVLALAKAAHYTHLSTKCFLNMDDGKALDESRKMILQFDLIDVADGISRAECLHDIQNKVKSTSRDGGKAKASNTEPLKQEVIQQYSQNYTDKTNRAAGKGILKNLEKEDNKLLLLSFADDKAHQFAKWIAQFRNGEIKITF
jgi:hypothetical protein